MPTLEFKRRRDPSTHFLPIVHDCYNDFAFVLVFLKGQVKRFVIIVLKIMRLNVTKHGYNSPLMGLRFYM